jgi:chitin disaccharide deacetylase
MSEKRVIVNADDFGMSASITDAILVAHRYGILTSTSLMANMPSAEYAVRQSKSEPKLGVGIHLNICQGKPILPLSEVRSLVDDQGNFHAPPVMIGKLWRLQVSSGEIEAEFRAQISWMKRHGLVPTHADSHHHMHIYPGAVRPFVRAMRAEGIQCARTARFSCWPKNLAGRNTIGGPHQGFLVRRVAVQAYRSVLQSMLLAGLACPDSRISFLARDRRDRDVLGARWRTAFENLPPGTYELACHPGLFDPAFSCGDRIHAERESELHCLTDRELRATLERNEIRLISYNDLARARGANNSAEGAVAL